ncbi:MAG: type II toxin-antitoxin system HipA family toxin [Methylococcales bacterium]
MTDVDVYVTSNIAGRLVKAGAKHVFSYHQDASEALSLTMPLRTESYAFQGGLHPVFQMNLPEGYLRQAIERATAKQYGSDDLTVLALLGSNQIGRMAYTLAGQPLAAQGDSLADLQTLLGSDDATLFNQLLTRFATCSGVAGVQPKVLLDIVKTKASLTTQSYIVKSWGDEYPELGCNEYVCLTLAKQAGLTVPETYLSDNGKLLISKRFDLNETDEPLGFEDFCVLQGKATREKYDASLESCANTIRYYVSPIYQQQALYDFFKLTLVNVLVKNGDAHLKNSGVIYHNLRQFQIGQTPEAERQLAPIFDVVSTAPYLPNDSMALSLTGSKRWPKWKVLQKFARQHCGLNNKQINLAVDEVQQASTLTLPLLNDLANQHSDFLPITEIMGTLLQQPYLK